MDIRGLQLEIKKGVKKPCYIIAGDDLFLRGEAEELLLNWLLKRGTDQEIEPEVYFASQMDFNQCLDSLHTLPLFNPEKLILIKEAEKLNQSHLEALKDFLSKVASEELTLILSFSKMDKRKKIMKELLKLGSLVEVKTPFENQLTGWLDYLALKKKITLTAQAKSQLVFMVGPSLAELSQNLDKLKEVFGDEKIDLAQVNEVIEKTRVQDIFQICDLMGQGKIPEALQQTEQSLRMGQSAIGCLQLMFRHFRILETLLRHKNVRISAQDLAAKVGVPKFFLNNYQRQSQGWNLKKLSQVFKALEAADLSLKSTRLQVESVFSALMLEVYGIKHIKKGSSKAPELISGLF